MNSGFGMRAVVPANWRAMNCGGVGFTFVPSGSHTVVGHIGKEQSRLSIIGSCLIVMR
jgi:hypothetical protein